MTPDLNNIQFTKLVKLFKALNDFSCFTQCPQYIYLEMLLRRHYALVKDKKQLLKICPELNTPSLKSVLGILNVPTLLIYNDLSELV